MNVDGATVQWIITGLIGLVVWFSQRTVITLEKNIETLKSDLQNVKIDYLHKNEFKDFKIELRLLFDELKLDIRAMRDAS